MKKLTKIRVINWHYLANETIHIKNNVLLTGQNASGKSTILDAIFFVITAGETQFNLAANDKGRRELRGYVKCKLGAANAEYLRNGDVSAHIALEFYDEFTRSYTTVGVVLDAFGDVAPVKTLFYETNVQIDDHFFIDKNDKIYGTVEFRKYNKDFEYYLTRKEAKRAFRITFGSINEDFFKLIPKALAFKPIPDVKEFIYQNILEEKEIDVGPIIDSIRSYKELESTLKLIKSKITDLKEIEIIYGQIKEKEKEQRQLTYLINLFSQEKIIDDAKKAEGRIEDLEFKKTLNDKKLKSIEAEIESLQERSKELYSILSNNQEFKASEYLDKRISNSKKAIEDLKNSKGKYINIVNSLNSNLDELTKYSNRVIYKKLLQLPLLNIQNEKIEEVKLDLININRELKELSAACNQDVGSLNIQKQELIKEINEVRNSIEALKDNRVRYNSSLIAIRNEIQEGLKRLYRVDISVHIFSELLEITNPSWHDTVEIYLGNRRFDLIVEPRYFDAALQIFSRIKGNYKLYGVGLVNTKHLDKYESYSPNSLASIITSDNIDAKRYVNMSCGNVIMVDDEMQLENYPTSITNNGLSYSRHTVRSLNPNIDKPFIGKGAANEQLLQKTADANKLRDSYMKLNSDSDKLNKELSILNELDIKTILDNLDNASLLLKEEKILEDLLTQKDRQTINSSTALDDEYTQIDVMIKDFESQKVNINREQGSFINAINSNQNTINNVSQILAKKSHELLNLLDGDIAFEQEAKKMFEGSKNKKQIDKDIEKFNKDLVKSKDLSEDISQGLMAIQFSFINNYNSNLSVGVNEIPKYFVELEKLERSELVKYEQKVRQAREEAEVVFKEDFLSKLRNNIKTAESEMAKINETLHGIQFGNDTYEFIFPKSKHYSAFYEMVTTDIDDGSTSFLTVDFQNKYQQQLDELFTSLAVDETNSKGAINKFTDYRTYMDYDIKITTKTGDVMMYSKIFREKSGGETQVPFYVSILASFVRVYTKSKIMNSDPIGIVLLDEVFDKMDANRIKAMMTFIDSLPLQVFLACPPEKLSILSQFTDTTLIMVRNNTRSQVMSISKNEVEKLIEQTN